MKRLDLSGWWAIFRHGQTTWAETFSSEDGARRVFLEFGAGCDFAILCRGREVQDHSPHITRAAAQLIAYREHGRHTNRRAVDLDEEFARA